MRNCGYAAAIARFRTHLSFANVVSLIALFVALGGTSYAVAKLPKNSVGTKQLRKNSVTGVKVKDRSLGAGDFKPGALPPGPAGPAGPQGPAGPSAAFQKSLQSTVTNLPTYFSRVLSLDVPTGSYFATATVQADTPTGAAAGVSCRLINGPGGFGSFAVTRGTWIAGAVSSPYPVQTLSLSGAFTIPEAAIAGDRNINIDCLFSAPTTARIGEANIVALRTGSVTGNAQ